MRKLLKAGIIIMLFISFLFVSKTLGDMRKNALLQYSNENIQTIDVGMISDNKAMTFRVIIPNNTPDTDTIYMYSSHKYKMQKVGDFIYEVNLTRSQIFPDGDRVQYRYSRNGQNFYTAEYLEPDTNDYFWTKKGRVTNFKAGEVQQDEIGRWRWFPPEGVPIVRSTAIEPSGTFLSRINNIEFGSGQIIEDLYFESFYEFLNSTAQHMSDVGYRWVEIDPPWQMFEENGLPKIANLIENAPNYPDDQTLIDEINAYKSHGLKVRMAPQLCCTPIDTRDRSVEWWDVWFNETTTFLVHFADIAQKAGVDAMHYAVGPDNYPSDYEERWSNVFKEIRRHFSGQVGEMVWNLGADTGQIIPDAKYITWGNELDYFYIAIDAPISLKWNPTDQELKEGADKMLDGVKQLYDTYGKPIVVRTTYFNVKGTWKGSSFYQISDPPWYGSEEMNATGKYVLGTEDLARTVNAYFKSIAERPWIIGYGQFGYTHWENPLTPDLAVRGKPAEDLWNKWHKIIYPN